MKKKKTRKKETSGIIIIKVVHICPGLVNMTALHDKQTEIYLQKSYRPQNKWHLIPLLSNNVIYWLQTNWNISLDYLYNIFMVHFDMSEIVNSHSKDLLFYSMKFISYVHRSYTAPKNLKLCLSCFSYRHTIQLFCCSSISWSSAR